LLNGIVLAVAAATTLRRATRILKEVMVDLGFLMSLAIEVNNEHSGMKNAGIFSQLYRLISFMTMHKEYKA